MLTNDPAEAALMAAVCAAPPDDDPRVAYADWVERNAGDEGVARAEYIRGTIRAYRNDNELEDRRTVRLLTEARKTSWSNGVTSLNVSLHRFVRGFVASIRADAQALLKHGTEIASRGPLQYVGVNSGARGCLRELLHAPWMEHVFSLDLGKNDLTDDDARVLAESGRSGLRWVNLDENPMTMQAAEVMAAATKAGKFPELHTLHLPLPIYDDQEGGFTVWRPPAGLALRDKYGELPWLTPRPAAVSGFHYA
jgi:uncharacterized protein (TIGR02996 family)